MNVQPLKEVLSKPMSRQDFLRTVGIAMLGLFGVSNFLHYFTQNNQPSHHSVAQVSHSDHGFGARPFGS